MSLVAAQTGTSFSPFVTKRGGSLCLLRGGSHTADELFSLAERDNVVITWLVRLAGFLAMFLGLRMVSAPLEVVLDRVPCIGRFARDLMAGATGMVACLVAATLSLLTIAIAWLAYRPLLTFTLLAVVGSLVYVMKTKVDTKRRAAAGGEIPTVRATPIYTSVSSKGNGIV